MSVHAVVQTRPASLLTGNKPAPALYLEQWSKTQSHFSHPRFGLFPNIVVNERGEYAPQPLHDEIYIFVLSSSLFVTSFPVRLATWKCSTSLGSRVVSRFFGLPVPSLSLSLSPFTYRCYTYISYRQRHAPLLIRRIRKDVALRYTEHALQFTKRERIVANAEPFISFIPFRDGMRVTCIYFILICMVGYHCCQTMR